MLTTICDIHPRYVVPGSDEYDAHIPCAHPGCEHGFTGEFVKVPLPVDWRTAHALTFDRTQNARGHWIPRLVDKKPWDMEKTRREGLARILRQINDTSGDEAKALLARLVLADEKGDPVTHRRAIDEARKLLNP